MNNHDDGGILLGFIDDLGMSLKWEASSLGRTRVVELDNRAWELKVLASAFESMEQEAGKLRRAGSYWPA